KPFKIGPVQDLRRPQSIPQDAPLPARRPGNDLSGAIRPLGALAPGFAQPNAIADVEIIGAHEGLEELPLVEEHAVPSLGGPSMVAAVFTISVTVTTMPGPFTATAMVA